MKKITIYLLSSMLTIGLFAAKDISSNTSSISNADKTNVGTCNPSTTQIDLDINNIRARLLGGGDFWWDGVTNAQYEYPKADLTTGEIRKNVIFAGALWFTGLDDGGNLRCAAQTYRNQGHDFWTGPLEIGGNIPDDVCSNFDNHFMVLGANIDLFRATYEANGFSISESEIHPSILEWPGKGNVYLENHPTLNKWYFNDGSLAPFFDADNDGIYNPLNGDYPVIKPCDGSTDGKYADQMIFWVINDNGNTHGRTNGAELGVQVNCLAFAFQTSDEINDMTFYTYEILKKTSGNLSQTYMGVFVDPDLGEFADDFIGCDTVRSVGYCYNADNDDAIYGPGPPIMAIDYFEGPIGDSGNELGLSSFVYFNNCGSGPQCDPDDAAGFRNFQTGLWGDGTPITCGNNGFGGSTPTNFVYPASPHLAAGGGDCDLWSECSAGIAAADRRFLQNSGPFTLTSAQSQRISIGVIVVETDENTYNGCPDIEAEIGVADNKAQFLFDNCFGIVDGPDAPSLKIREMSNQLAINLINEKSSNNYGENYSVEASGAPSGTDDTYDFEGYLLFQLADNSVTAKDLSDPAKAKLILQSDIKNGVSNAINYTFDNLTGMYLPSLVLQGEDNGVKRSILVTEDQFADGESGLVNFTTYYFAAVAYAFNNHTQFDPMDPNNASSQLEQYLQGRRNFNVYSAIPHEVQSEVGGTILNAEYGQGLLVKRLEGQGNGGKNLELTEESKNQILANNFSDIIEYEPLFDPIGVKVIDPLKVQNVDFEMVLRNDLFNGITDSSYWYMTVTKEGQVVDTINSTRLMDRPFEQIVEDYGISVNVGRPLPVNENLSNNAPVYDYIGSSISYEDESKKWLSFITDESNGGDLSPSNWQREGDFLNTSYLANVYDSHQYDELGFSDFYDEEAVFANIIDGGWAPYCLTANYKKDAVIQDPIDPTRSTPNSVHGPAFLWDVYNTSVNDVCFNPKNTLEKLQSVDIVLTSNKDLWSKCIVFETGEDEDNTIGGSNKGQIRNQPSVDKNGNETGVDNGYSYFPGYAINLETGERLNIAFGEGSDRVDNNGSDMIWNPTDKDYDGLTNIAGTESRVPVFGGKHFIYVFETRYDECAAMHSVLTSPANFNDPSIPQAVENIYDEIMYTSNPLLTNGFELLSLEDGLIPNDVTMKIRVERPYAKLGTNQIGNDSLPRYGFSTVGLAPEFNNTEVAESTLDNIRVVPNPYYAYSAYEVGPNNNVVKITNLPDVCEISIFTLDGKLVRRFDRAVGSGGNLESSRQDLSLGQVVGISNLNNSLDWNLKNHKDIPVSSGTYLIYINAPGVGETVVKSAVFIRPPEIRNF